jgi:uncharacterized repeat protein (TIGR03803 family)
MRYVVAAVLLPTALDTCAQNIQPIYSFPQSPAIPFAALVQGPDGNFYGTTFEGGSGGEGTVFKVTTNGVMTKVYSFGPPLETRGTYITNADGAQPWAALALGPDGNLYGTTWKGGSGGNGTVFNVTTNGVLSTLHFFGASPDGANPEAGLTLGPDGNFYGTTSGGGTNGYGTVFKVTTNGVLTTLHSFTALNSDGVTGDETNSDGAAPNAGLTLGTNGALYGATYMGGSGGSGTLFEITTNGTWTTFYTFSACGYNDGSTGEVDTNSDGANPTAALALGSDGNFYGTTDYGGKSGSGTVFKATPSGALTTLYTFAAGRTVFSSETDLYTNLDGAQPHASLTPGPNGNFFGATTRGGNVGAGTLFEVTTGGTLTTLLTFTNGNGTYPNGGLALGSNGNFYGATEGGGSSGNGTVFEVTTNGAFTTLYDFANYNGASPYAGLTLGPNGNFYGATYQGGTNGAGVQVVADGYGTAFELTTNGALTTIINFANTNGANPEANLVQGPNGNFYGTTYSGGSNNDGSVFELTTNDILTTLASFAGTNGLNPAASLILGTNGNFYGTSAYGGKDGYGTVFELTNTGGFTALHSFTDSSDGASPAGLTLGPNGNFYGTTAGDGSSTYGNVFEMTSNGALTNLYTFTNGTDSASPDAALTLGPDGNFYGTTFGNYSGDPYAGGINPWGTVFEVTSNGAFSTLVSFAGTNGENSKASLTLGPDGNFYGTTSYGGADGIGEIYRLDLPPEIIQQPASQSAVTGAGVTLSVTLFGTAPYSFQWMSNNIPIAAATNDTLTISDFAAADAADYSVIVSNAWGSATSTAASLTVWGGPLISGITLSADGNVTLECQSLSNVVSRLWTTTNLAVQSDWTPIFTNSTTSPGGAWQFTDTNTLYQQRYYRLSMP